MIVVVLLAIVQLSCGAVPLMRNIMDPQIMGFLYELPEDEDPLLVQHQLSSIGAMPIFALLESAKKGGNFKIDGISEKVKIAESKRIIDDAMSRLDYARVKLEKGNGNINTDVEKVIQSLKALNKPARPDIRQVLDSLESIMTLGEPMMRPIIKELATTSTPETYEKTEVIEKNPTIDRQALTIRLLPNSKPESEEKPTEKNPFNSAQHMSAEKPSEEEKSAEEKSISSESSEISKESHEASKPPFQIKMKEKKDSSFDGEDMISSYKAKITWKEAGMV
nr:uncharacterized protein LOC107445782 isoform X2 [Parasteatoda tepidariorum]